MTLVQTVYILKKDKYEQNSNWSRNTTTTSSTNISARHPKGTPAPITTKKGDL